MEVCFCFRCLLKSFTVKQKSFNDAVKGFEYSFLDFIQCKERRFYFFNFWACKALYFVHSTLKENIKQWKK